MQCYLLVFPNICVIIKPLPYLHPPPLLILDIADTGTEVEYVEHAEL